MNDHFYLKGLNGLRAFASISVVIGHIELVKKNSGVSHFFDFVSSWGSLGVTLFFVLSGFLITTLLQKEKENSHNISLKKFYIRRILRVWPLYYLILILSWLILDSSPSLLSIFLCGTIFPNIAHAIGHGWIASPQLWSIGVEEQFYLFWPTLMKKKTNLIIGVSLLLIFIYPFSPHILQFIMSKLNYGKDALLLTEKLFEVLNFNAMATGALFSILYFGRYRFFATFLSKISDYRNILMLLPFVLWFSGAHFIFFQGLIYSALFGLLLVLVIDQKDSSTFLESNPLNFLGKISYGIYMYHWIIMMLFLNVFESHLKTSPILGNLLFYTCTISITIMISSFSYFMIEKRILLFKDTKFSTIIAVKKN